ncbi:uncharacterized protein N0V89_008856 [Didymosphaeria variabile]|uniref:AA1-like domain-containing protein n=1 Tax=Didymosphaeria variabile TaxID=1932322 RepID=A0A9W8XGQ7_9PLEO|nr:uncharacterized protein N0V89_008856 [Didymosphaeria variabile]KAJ4350235.1 hypothetical protein N0V89_008856 [Didymosphaeria variabile]
MKNIFAPILLLAGLTAANFDLYQVDENNSWDGSGVSGQWMIFEAEPDCDQALGKRDSFRVLAQDDVSDGSGVVCEPVNQCYYYGNPSEINRIEMNFNNDDPAKFHWTIYKDRNFDMIGLDGNVYGTCIVFPGDDFQCSEGTWSNGGKRMFRCLTPLTTQDIIAGNGGGMVGR